MDKAIDQFLEISKIDSRDVAQYYLSVTDGDVEAAIGMLFEDTNASSQQEVASTSEPTARIVVDASNPKITVLEWNIQGLLADFLSERMKATVDIIKQEKPTVIMLQEVILETYLYLKSSLKDSYIGFSPAESSAVCGGYFTAIFVEKSIFKSCTAKVIPFPDSAQARQILVVSGQCYHHDVTVMTSHFESTKSGEPERKRQLAILYSTMTKVPGSHSVIFGGDTNLRDYEFNNTVEIGRFNPGIVQDVWTALGSPQDVKYSWDLQKNDNQIENGKARLRFERMYMRKQHKRDNCYFQPESMRFVGLERLPCGKFISDHWGLLATFTA